MGCDIHPHVEIRRDGRWERLDWRKRHETGEYYDPERRRDPKVDYDKLFEDPLYINRNYCLFSILADVRNGYGFAGCDTGDKFVPVAEPRDLPADVTAETLSEYVYYVMDGTDDEVETRQEETGENLCSRERAEDWVRRDCSASVSEKPYRSQIDPSRAAVTGPDYHSASWVSVADLLAYDWNRTVKRRGWVDPWNFELYRTRGKPSNWSGGISGGSIEHVTNAWMARAIDSGEIQWVGDPPGEDDWDGRPYSTSLQRGMSGWDLKPGTVGGSIRDDLRPRHYTNIEWTVTYRECVEKFLTATLPALQSLGSPEDVRLVFWFDN